MDTLEQMQQLLKKRVSQGSAQNRESDKTLQDSDVCPICRGVGFIPITEDGVTRYRKCECYIKEMQSRRLRFANIPDSLKGITLKDFSLNAYQMPESKSIVKIACNMVKVYLDNFKEMQTEGMGLYIYSHEKGSGKTFITAAIANELLKEHQVKFASSGAILTEIKSTYNKDTEYTESKLLDELIMTEILVIDDFGQENVTGWVNDKFYQIINERYLAKKVTLFTSNESIRSLKYDSRITNRIMERVYEIQFAEESVREHIADQNRENLLSRMKGDN